MDALSYDTQLEIILSLIMKARATNDVRSVHFLMSVAESVKQAKQCNLNHRRKP